MDDIEWQRTKTICGIAAEPSQAYLRTGANGAYYALTEFVDHGEFLHLHAAAFVKSTDYDRIDEIEKQVLPMFEREELQGIYALQSAMNVVVELQVNRKIPQKESTLGQTRILREAANVEQLRTFISETRQKLQHIVRTNS